MKEFRIPESTIKRRLKFTLIFTTTIIVLFICFVILDQIKSGEDGKVLFIVTGFTLLMVAVSIYWGLKMLEKRLRGTKLILDDNFLIWISPTDGPYQIMYSDIKQVSMKKSKGIVLKLNHSFKKIYLLKFIEDIDSIYLLLQKEIDKQTV